MLKEILGRVSAGEDLSTDEMQRAIEAIMRNQCTEDEIASLLTSLRAKGETATEVAGAAKAMRACMTPIRSDCDRLLDPVGTGGDGSGTFNISTAAAIVAAAAGASVAKHGNRGMTSKSGSADVLRELGVNIEASVEQVERCLEVVGICFCYAPLFHHSMKHVAKVRRELGVPTIFNILGPLCNPARAPFQLIGVGRSALRGLLADALLMLDCERAVVVHGEDGLDEVTLNGVTSVSEVCDGEVRQFQWAPADFDLQPATKDSMCVASPQESADLIRHILDGKHGPPRDIVVLNAAAALWVANIETDLRLCAARAADAIDSDAAANLLARLAEVSNEA